MTTADIQSLKLSLLEEVMNLTSKEELAQVLRYVRQLNNVKTYDIPQDLLEEAFKRSEENKRAGRCIGEEEMNEFIDSLK